MNQDQQTKAAALYLVIEGKGTLLALERIVPLLARIAVPSLLVAPAAGHVPATDALRSAVSAIQDCGTAVLIADDAGLAADCGADGVHLSANAMEASPLERFAAARERLGPDAIVGADAGGSRHDAMALGEAGADYVAFSANGSDDSRTDEGARAETGIVTRDSEPASPWDSLDAHGDLIAWWAEIFEVPVVAFGVTGNTEASRCASAGADFVARIPPAGLSPADLGAWLENAASALVVSPRAANAEADG